MTMTGSTLSHYKIVEELGRGGMGIVYKAEDTKLDRTVAIKVLPAAALASKDDRERFYREAKSAAALNHPHIAQVYEIDEAVPSDAPHGTEPSPFIAMEFIDGQPLDEAVRERPFKLEKAVALAIQMAQALEAAHEKGIVHRDIKSANVMLTAKGQAKVLDFGLAKTAHSTMLTRMGSTLGTVAYMSPEQARGEEVDHRTDLWALGVVLYELVSGRNPFGADYEQAVVYSILNEEPEPLTAVRTGVPMQLEWIVGKCLAKDAGDRYQSAKDLVVDLRKVDVSTGSGASQTRHFSGAPASVQSGVGAAPTQRQKSALTRRHYMLVAAALVGGLVIASIGFILGKPAPETRPMTRVVIPLADVTSARFSQLSSTREYLAFAGVHRSGTSGLMLRNMRTGDIRRVRNTENLGVREFGISPDGSRIAYTQGANAGVYVVDIPNGIPVEITTPGRFAFWKDNATIAVTDDRAGGGDSWLIDVETLEKTPIRVKDPKLDDGYGNVLKTIVPGTDRAFGIQLIRRDGGGTNAADPANLFTLNLSSGELDVIARNASNIVHIQDAYVGYQIGGDAGELVVQAFDPATGELLRSAVSLTELGVNQDWGDYSFTAGGDLLYVGAGQSAALTPTLFEFDLERRAVVQVPLLLPTFVYPRRPRYSPDGARIAFQDSEAANVYEFNLETGQQTQFTFDGGNSDPVYDPDGQFIYFIRIDTTTQSAVVNRMPIDNVAGIESMPDALLFPSFSDDGELVAGLLSDPSGTTRTAENPDAFVLRNRRTGAEVFLDSSRAGPRFQDFSPDGRYIVTMDILEFESTFTIYSADGRQTISLPGASGFSPRFSPDGKWLYFAKRAGVYRLPIRLTPTFAAAGQAEQIIVTGSAFMFDVSPDGSSLAISATLADFVSEGAIEDIELVWLQNFTEFLEDELDE